MSTLYKIHKFTNSGTVNSCIMYIVKLNIYDTKSFIPKSQI